MRLSGVGSNITPQEDDVEVILSAVKHLLCAKSVLKSRNANPVGIKPRTPHSSQREVVKATSVSEGGLKSERNNRAKTPDLYRSCSLAVNRPSFELHVFDLFSQF